LKWPNSIQVRICEEQDTSAFVECPFTCGATCSRSAHVHPFDEVERPLLRHGNGI
jgi:hypothetical protein